ncbi:4Fe-4S ferredoxin [bacterium SM23_31]|nr:MAG: 4Fe-4S ferredoxin [bacterium SM23_31]
MEKTIKKPIKITDISKSKEQLVKINPQELVPLPPPYDKPDNFPKIKQLTEEQEQQMDSSLDGFVLVGFPKSVSEEQEKKWVEKFLSGVKKLLNKEDNWTFLKPLLISLEYCTKCQTCSKACNIFQMSGEKEIYRPTYRAEVLRRIIKKYIKPGGRLFGKFYGADIDLNRNLLARLAELSYRCTLCRRCAQACSIGIDNALITREIRKIFSQELDITVPDLHKLGTVQQLETGSSTGMPPLAFKDNIEFLEEDFEEYTKMKFNLPVNVPNADILLIHNAGEYLAWPENPEAFGIILEAAGISYTLSSDLVAYDSVNYGLFYDDIQLAKIALKHAEIAKKLGVKKIVLGECGHAHKALGVVADRIFTSENNIPRESCLTLLKDIVFSGKLALDPSRNDFPVTLHDPCNIVRSMGIVEPQRKILRKICPKFREMTPHGIENYCCGGGSGFAICKSLNFPDWRMHISGRMKLKQILEAFQGDLGPENKKYVCAPCSNCKGQIRDLFKFYKVTEKSSIYYGGLVELIVNAMSDIKKPFIEWEML